ncbi:hypothetical protein [Aquitalea sp. LB_tupeE]|uniref:hypothetical protein n=1 Tax=Aquitalea sp. LB_tupeE TaxID=2748078 RepID=UPI0015BC748C|nr:hypothetical protein [Aquitalea sp. LB_tupeE]NWK79407.1 hypothetical protein [Aquitalea sp. LB_tupeE]
MAKLLEMAAVRQARHPWCPQPSGSSKALTGYQCGWANQQQEQAGAVKQGFQ